MYCRKNVAALSTAEKNAFVDAVLKLKAGVLPAAQSRIPAAATAVTAAGGTPNRYDDYVWLHNQVGFGAHRRPAFGPWHREFVRQFEADLKAVSGDPALTVPYWDYAGATSPASAGWPFTDDLMGGFGSAASFNVTTGPFADPTVWRINFQDPQRCPGTQLRRRRVVAGALPPRLTVRNGLKPTPLAPYDAAPFDSNPNTLTAAQRAAQTAASFRKFLEWNLHDGVHVWVSGIEADPANPGDILGGHMTLPAVAVNDPIFWLLHCNVDRLWTLWQQLHFSPPYTGTYQPASGAPLGHNLGDTMSLFATPSWFNIPLRGRPSDLLDNHALDTWYQSDKPEVTLVSSSVNFGDVPEDLTTFKPVQFDVRSCQPVKFRITGVSAGNFSEPMGQGVVQVDHSEVHDPVRANVYVQFHSTGTLNTPQNGSVAIEAFIEDPEGYFAATEGGEFIVGSWPLINLTARPVPKMRSAVTFVLDRSGSMAESAGPMGTKYDLLKSSLRVVADVMTPDDAIALISFDDLVTTIAPVRAIGTNAADPTTGKYAVSQAITGPDLVPRGLTAIGSGMIQGASVLDAERTAPGTPYSQFGMVVMTDGNQNVGPSVTDPAVTTAIAGFSDNVYAIGLGSETNVSAPTLGAIARYMLITGNITSAEQRFSLTKYFIQVLAGVTRTAIVTDPQGDLLLGSEHQITFDISDSDVTMDAITLCPLAPILDLRLVTPDGTIIDRNTVSPNIALAVNREDVFYRIKLPALPANPAGSHAGRWTAILRVGGRGLGGIVTDQNDDIDSILKALASVRSAGTLPYSFLVQSYSNLAMAVDVIQASADPGETLKLVASLSEYQVAFQGSARVVVEITDPTGGLGFVTLSPTDPGRFEGTYATFLPGIYRCRFRAAGYTRHRQPFQREETRTAAIWKQRPGEGVPSGPGDQDRERWCRLIECLLRNRGIQALLERQEVDTEELVKCLREYCAREESPGH
jgi:hypothetical protein